jgi:phosphoribosylglycinamide formyltransferase-1
MNKKIIQNITVFVSGGGSNLQALIDAEKSGALGSARIALVLSSSKNAYALERAAAAGIPTKVVSGKDVPDETARTEMILSALDTVNTDLIVLAGYMKILPPTLVRRYQGRILNIHPSLIPKHCGKGYYGLKVHESVIASGDQMSGATVHWVDEGVDTGEIIIQAQVPVLPQDRPEDLAARVLETEHRIIVEAVRSAIEN